MAVIRAHMKTPKHFKISNNPCKQGSTSNDFRSTPPIRTLQIIMSGNLIKAIDFPPCKCKCKYCSCCLWKWNPFLAPKSCVSS